MNAIVLGLVGANTESGNSDTDVARFETYGQWFFCGTRTTFCMDDVYFENALWIWSHGPSYTHAWYVSIDESRSNTGMNAYGIYC